MEPTRFKVSQPDTNSINDDSPRHSGITLRAYNLMRKASRKISANETDQRKFSFAHLTRYFFLHLASLSQVCVSTLQHPNLRSTHVVVTVLIQILCFHTCRGTSNYRTIEHEFFLRAAVSTSLNFVLSGLIPTAFITAFLTSSSCRRKND